MIVATLPPLHGGTGAEVTLAGYLVRLLAQLLAIGALGLVIYQGLDVLAARRSAAVADPK